MSCCCYSCPNVNSAINLISVAVYVSELRALAQYCSFGETLEVMLQDIIVCGMNDQQNNAKEVTSREGTLI